MSGKCLLDTNIVIALFADETIIKENLARIDDFAESNVVLGCDTVTAHFYGEIKNALRVKGNPIPENDIWIAAVALQHGLTLVTRDAHFSEIENLKILAW